jgi:formate dehydrogenase maturation protein FdhE
MEYFFSDSEKEYRVYTCKNCKGYLKSVDLRELARPFYAPLEALLTTHLDLKAQQIGFHTTVPSWQTL